MPDLRFHFKVGIFLSLIVVSSFLLGHTPFNSLTSIPFILFFSIFADIDSYSSHIRTFFIAGGIIAIVILSLSQQYLYMILLAGFILFAMFQKHRGQLHSLVSASLIPLPTLYFGLTVYIASAFAYIAHLLFDREVHLL